MIQDLQLDRGAQESTFDEQWDLTEIQIITLDGFVVGWMQTKMREDGVFLAQLFVDTHYQGQGIGTEVLNRLLQDSQSVGLPVHLSVVKTNRALQLYE